MRHAYLALLISLLTCSVLNATSFNEFTQEANSFFNMYVTDGSVDYQAIRKNIQQIESLYLTIGTMSLNNLSAVQQKSFYINAYNLIVIYWVAKHYPLKSPLDNSGFFDKVKHRVAGELMTLNILEIKKLLSIFNDAKWLRVNSSLRKVELCKIFDWYKKDFATNGINVIDWINQYRKEKIPTTFIVTYYEYDWTLNDR